MESHQAPQNTPTKFVHPPSSHLLCPYCHELLDSPVLSVKCGHTFCEKCGKGNEQLKCPIDSERYTKNELIPNKAVIGQIKDLLIYCRNALNWSPETNKYVLDFNGCPEKVPLGKRDDHEKNCMFTMVTCPNSEHCGQFRKRSLDQHLKECSNYACPNNHKGCTFTSTEEALKEHIGNCSHDHVGDFQPSQVENLLKENKSMEKTIKVLTERVAHLEHANQGLTLQLDKCVRGLKSLEQRFEEHVAENRIKSPSSGSLKKKHRHPSSSGSAHGGLWTMPFQFVCIGTLRGHKGPVFNLTASLSRHTLYSCSKDSVIKLWDMQALSKGSTQTLFGHTDTVTCIVAGHELLYSMSDDLSLRSWKISDGSECQAVENAFDESVCAAVCNEDYLFTASPSSIRVWDAATIKQVHTINGLSHVKALTLNPTKDSLYSGQHNTIHIWDAVNKFTLRGKLDHLYGSTLSVVVTSQLVIAGTYNQNVQVFDVKTKEHVKTLTGHVGTISCMTVSCCGRFLFTGSSDSTIQIWNLDNMLPIHILARHEQAINAVTLYTDYLLSASDDHEIKVFKYCPSYNLK